MALAPRVLLGCAFALLAGCGNSRTPVPSATRPSLPHGFSRLTVPYAGVSLDVPRNWTILMQQAPLVVTISSGTAVVALWRFVRPGPTPADGRALASARKALIAVIQARDRTLELLRTGLARIAGAPAVELIALQRVDGQPRRVSSTHVYLPGVELVLDAYAPPAQFGRVNATVFSPLRRSLALIKAGKA